MTIKQVAVLGAGVMGASIAAHVANAGVPVLLLDIVPENATDRNVLANTAVEKLLKANPAAFMHPKNAKLVSTGNLQDDMAKLANCDWIIEAVIERPDIKSDLYKKVDAVRAPHAIVSSNTSTIPLAKLVEGQSDAFKAQFLITHFFNPPRYMHLLEIVSSKDTNKDAVKTIEYFADKFLGKGVVLCHDTPGFIANRIGAYWIQVALNAAQDFGLSVEEVDALLSKPIGVPKTGVFGLLDLIGLDLMPHLSKSLLALLPKTDAYHGAYRDWPLLQNLIADGYTGRKGKGGFYRLNTEGGKKQKEVLRLNNGADVAFAPEKKTDLAAAAAGKAGLKAVVTFGDKYGDFVASVMAQTLWYAAGLVPEIADDVPSVDRGMQWGFNWKFGPFELIDQLGAQWLLDYAAKNDWAGKGATPKFLESAAAKEGFYKAGQYLTTKGDYTPIAYPEGVLRLDDIKAKGAPLFKNGSASLWDLGDGVVNIEFHTKMNTMDPEIFKAYHAAIKIIAESGGAFKALTIYNDGENFSAGANLGLALFALNVGAFDQIDQLIDAGQGTYRALKYAPFPVVAAPCGLALGGGCEILLHADSVVAHAETYSGLVEAGVGIIPGWGGCTQMILRWQAAMRAKGLPTAGGPMPAVVKTFEAIAQAKVSTSAPEMFDLLYLREGTDKVCMNRDRLLADAKARALELAQNYQAPDAEKMLAMLPGPAGAVALNMALSDFQKTGKATVYDGVVGGALIDVITGGSDADPTKLVSEVELLALEKIAFMKLVHNEGTLQRMAHMLNTGKPLRN